MKSLGPIAVLLTVLAACSTPAPPGPPAAANGNGKSDGFGSSDRDAVAAIEAWNRDLSPDERGTKYCKMATSPFAFYRGSNHLFWADLAGSTALARFGSDATRTVIQGDLHAANLGAFDDDHGLVVFDLNDFDEALVADYQYDVWRMAVSLVLIARAANLDEARAVDAFSEAYLDAMHDFRGTDDELPTAITLDDAPPVLSGFLDKISRKEGRAEALADWTVVDASGRHFDLSNPDLAAVSPATDAELRAAMPAYGATLSGRLSWSAAYFAVKSVAARLHAGIGSLGNQRYYLLIEGETPSVDDDRILDVKLETTPTAYRFLPSGDRAAYDAAFKNPAARYARTEKALLDNVDDHLGWMHLESGDFSVRERSVYKKSFPLEDLDEGRDLADLAAAMGRVVAAGHARADRDFDPGLVPVSVDREIDLLTDGDHDEFRRQVRDLARAYADQVDSDYAAFLERAPLRCPPP